MTAAMSLPVGVTGVTSPYPTVVSVAMHHHDEAGMLWKALGALVPSGPATTHAPAWSSNSPRSAKKMRLEKSTTAMARNMRSSTSAWALADRARLKMRMPLEYRESLKSRRIRASRRTRRIPSAEPEPPTHSWT